MRGGRAHLLEVVEHEQQPPAAQVVGDEVGRGQGADLAQPKRPRDRRQDQIRVGDRGQRDEDDAIGEGRCRVLGDAQREAGLAHPARTGQGEQADPMVDEQVARGRGIGGTADERGQRLGEIPPCRRRDGVRFDPLHRDRAQAKWDGSGGRYLDDTACPSRPTGTAMMMDQLVSFIIPLPTASRRTVTSTAFSIAPTAQMF